jgi:single-stranded-DNA-specific exonuclease RecJ
MVSSDRILLREVQDPESQEFQDLLAQLQALEGEDIEPITPALLQLLLQRGLDSVGEIKEFLQPSLSSLHSPWLLQDMETAVDLIAEAIDNESPIWIHGDYDVDGASAVTLLTEGFKILGAQTSFHVPDRFTEGYGLSVYSVEQAAEKGYGLVLTVDCGSSSWEAVKRAKELGLTIIITDHHHLPEQWPAADAFINPQRPDCEYPSKAICGTGVAFKLLCALCESLGFAFPDQMLDLVALATVADVVELKGENRALVHHGLRQLSKLERPGLRALAEVSDLLDGPWGSFAVGFGLGPRLNAAGRLVNARLAVELLLESDLQRCREQAKYLDRLNRERKEVEQNIRLSIGERIEADPSRLELGLIAEAGDDWHQGVVGITASRLVDCYQVPAFVMGRVGDTYKGSARSAENVDLFEWMSLTPELFVKFGGHSRAAGFTIESHRLDEMRQRLSETLPQIQRGGVPLRVDLQLSIDQVGLPLVRQLELLEPVGEGNRSPLFLARGVRLEEVKSIGKSQEHLRFYVVQNNVKRKAVAFRQGGEVFRLKPRQLYYDIVYRVQEETYQGETYASLLIEAILEPNPDSQSVLSGSQSGDSRESLQLLDARNVIDRRAYLEGLLAQRASEEILLIVNTPEQAQKVHQVLSDLGLEICRYSENSRTAAKNELVLLYPPSQLDVLSKLTQRPAGRIHCLFGERELAWESGRQESRCIDRPKLEQIWRSLRTRSRGGVLDAKALGTIESELKAFPAPRQSILSAISVLQELGWANWQGDLLMLQSSGGRRLEESARFATLAAEKEASAKVVRFFQKPRLDLSLSV